MDLSNNVSDESCFTNHSYQKIIFKNIRLIFDIENQKFAIFKGTAKSE